MDAGTQPTVIRNDQVPFLKYPSPRQDDPSRRQCLIYLIPGNPGLIAYYEPFMKALRQLLNEKEAKEGCQSAFHIYGRNLLGFDDADHTPLFGTTTTPSGTQTEPFTLEDQIVHTCASVTHVSLTTLSNNRPFSSVTLIGHSVGAYITLELFHRHHLSNPSTPLRTVPLHSAVLLTPTISHIARSRSGQKLDRLRTTPLLDRSAHHVAKRFVDLVPGWLLGAVVRRVLGFPPHAAAATLRFLASRDGIWQALHMGKDEMRQIGEEVWGEELWEIQEAEDDEDKGEEKGDGGDGKGEEVGVGATKFWFYFAEKDHWVADEVRDEFIERRKREGKGGTRVVVDEGGIPHAFCINHSEEVAEKVVLWIGENAGL